MIKKISKYSILLFSIISMLHFSCTKDPLFDFIVGGQPHFLGDSVYTPRINVFGILRPDSLDSIPKSFIHLERTVKAINEDFEYMALHKATVVISKIENGMVADTFQFVYCNPDSVFFIDEFRSMRIRPKAGERYRLEITDSLCGTVTSETVIPNEPEIEGKPEISAKQIKLKFIPDTTIGIYEVYYLSESELKKVRVIHEPGVIPEAIFNTEKPVAEHRATILVYGYDKKLSTYYSFSNVFIKPNTYRPPFTTVEGGYGTFGSMNVKVITF